jgi:hypothetical protein
MDLEVRRNDLATTLLVDAPTPDPTDGQALLRIDHFGLSTNNVTFGVMGDLLGYWRLFPTADPAWGRVPVFGFADVIASRHPDVAEGTRVFGYLPMSRHLLVEPAKANARGFLDSAAHRRDVMATVWNHYQNVTDAHETPAAEARRSLLRPLFVTGFLIDFVADHDGFGADTVVISSASAKTAIATAQCMAERGDRRVVGLTSPARAAFAAGLGVYDDVLTYDEAGDVPGHAAVFVDIAGLLPARDAVHARFGERLVHSMTVGMSNVPDPERILAPQPEQGPTPEVFYAQLQVAKRASEWGQARFDQQLDKAWARFTIFTATWLDIKVGAGPEAVEAAWRRLLDGGIDPASGLDLTMWPPS